MSERFDTSIYRKTGSATALTVFKVIEGLAALGLMAFLFNINNDLERELKALYESMLGLASMSGQMGSYISPTLFIDVIHYFGLAVLAVVVVEAIASIMVRASGKGAGVLQFIHTLTCIVMFLSILLVIAWYGYLIYILYKGQAGFGTLVSTFAIVDIAIALAGVGLTFAYHRGIASVMKTIKKETKTGFKHPAELKGLDKESKYLAILYAGYAIYSAVTSKEFTLYTAGELLLALKFLLVSKCATTFEVAHVGSSPVSDDKQS